ncbi:MATE family efflux transporter [Formicincola oecophyllae]|uniref:MATE family efflux transporter n=1 Tax=Formicincola oecophyllae TaxID=2558361 RepID=A0A4Y6U911_9PROT|nr:MATE family efflux transporter [Formicincola oecophyllae]QDH13862.1 MATE family efflux transporter [Formicincola oecophyllae]
MNATTLNTPPAPDFASHLGAVVRVSLPLALSQLSEMAMGVTDTMLLGGVGVAALAVGGISNNFFMSTMITFQSCLGGAGVLLSHSKGAADHGREALHDGRAVMSAGLAVAVLITVPCWWILSQSGLLFAWLHEPADVVTQGSHFIDILLRALLPDICVIGLWRVALPALGAERLLLWIMPMMAVCNGILNDALIHGRWGLPRMGLFGSATATTLTGWTISLALMALCAARPPLRAVMLPTLPRWHSVKAVLKLGLPMMASAAAEILMFQITTLEAGQLGTDSLASHQVALNTASLLFMVCLAISQAANIRVAYWLGAGTKHEAGQSALAALALVVGWTCCTGGLLLAFPHVVAHWFYSAGTASAGTMAATVVLLRIAGLFQIVDGIQAVCTGILRGCGDVLRPMLTGIATYGVFGLGFGHWLAFRQGWGVTGLWVGLASGLGLTALVLGWCVWHRFFSPAARHGARLGAAPAPTPAGR